MADWIKKKKKGLSICCLQEAQFKAKDIPRRLKVSEWKNIFHANGKNKKAGVAILIRDQINFKTKSTIKDKERQYIMIKRI